MVCAVLLDRMFDHALVVDGHVPKQIPSNLPFPDGGPPALTFLTLEQLRTVPNVKLPRYAH